MNRFTLKFDNQVQEDQYMGHMCSQHIPIFVKTLYIYIIGIGLPFSILSFVQYDFMYGIFGSITVSTSYVLVLMAKKFPDHFNKIILFLNLMITLLIGAQIYFLNSSMENADNKIVLFYGMTSAQIQYIGYFLNQNFVMLAFQFILQNAVFTAITWNPHFLEVRWAYFCSSLLILFFLYEQIKIKKNNFLLAQGEKEWAHIVKNGLSQPIMTVKYNHKENFISLDILNQYAARQFNIKSPEDFKAFSRNVKVFHKDTSFDQVIQQNLFTQTDRKINNCATERLQNLTGQASPTSMDNSLQYLTVQTLENQIIQLIKQQIQNTKSIQDRRMSNSIPMGRSKNNSISQFDNAQRRKSVRQLNLSGTMIYQPQIYQFNGIYQAKQGEGQCDQKQKYTVKLSIFKQQTQYQCCIVFEQENSDLKIKKLQSFNGKQQANFMFVYLGLWMKLKAILDNLQYPNIIKSYIKLAFNQINNVRSHTYLIKKQTPFTKTDVNKESALREIIDNVQMTFYQFRESISFSYSDCNNQSLLFSNIPRICQILTNFIENALRQQLQLQYQRENNGIVQDDMQYQNQFEPNQQCQLNAFFREYKSGPSVLFQKQLYQEHSFTDYPLPLDSHKGLITNYLDISSRRGSKLEHSISPALKKSIVRVKFHLIEGDNPLSNIIKITIKDNNEVNHSINFEQILYHIGNKSQNTENYKEFKHLGWKVSLSIIGRIGPFYEMFINPDTSQGLQLHFYIYQNLNILDDNLKDVFFKNKEFEIDYKLSQQKYLSTQRKTLTPQKQITHSNLSFSGVPIGLQNNNIFNIQLRRLEEDRVVDQEYNQKEIDDTVSTSPNLNMNIDEHVSPIQNNFYSDKFQLSSIRNNNQQKISQN